MKNSGLLWWLGAFVLAALAGMLTYGLLTSAVPTPAAAGSRSDPNMAPVVVAAGTIPLRRSIGEGDVTVRNLPVDTIPAGAATTIEQVVGKMSTSDLVANEPLLTQNLVTPDVVTQQVALSVPQGKNVVVVPTLSKLISNRLVRPGDHVDLMATFEVEVQRGSSSGPLSSSVALMTGLEIHAIILPGTISEEGPTSLGSQEGGVFRTADEKGQSILLALDPQDALVIQHVLNVGGILDLALRATKDDSIIDTDPVDQFYLANRYRIDLNRN
jgi:Flp pilus assembly protein CpaB